MKYPAFLFIAFTFMSCDFSDSGNNTTGSGSFTLGGKSYKLNNAHIVSTFNGAQFNINLCLSNDGACVDYGFFENGTKEHVNFTLGKEWTSTSIPIGTISIMDSVDTRTPYLEGVFGALSTRHYGGDFSNYSYAEDHYWPDYSSPDYAASLSIRRNQEVLDVEFSFGPMLDGSILVGHYSGSIEMSPPAPKNLALD